MVSLVGAEAPAPSGSSSDNTANDQQIQKLQQLVNRQFAIADFKGAVPACEELCALISAKYDELHEECAGPYYQYATALLEIAREENQILGESKLNQEADEDDKDDAEAQPGSSSSAGPEEEAEEEAEEEEEEDVSSLQIAWEVLELARVIYSRQATPESQKHLANVKLKLGEICMEDEKLDEALVQFGEAIQSFIGAGEKRDSRKISSTYYMMGLAASLDQKYEDAVSHFAKCSELIQSQISQTEGTEKDSLTEMQREVDKMISDCKDSLKQLEQYRRLIPQGAAAGAAGAAGPSSSTCDSSTSSSTQPSSSSPASSSQPSGGMVSTSSAGFAPSSSSSAPVSNISHLVRKRPVSQPIQPISQSLPSSTSEITAKIIKPTVRVSPIVSSSTSPQPSRPTNGQSDSSDDISSSNGARSGGFGSDTTTTINGQNGVSSSTSSRLESRLAGSTSGFTTPSSGFATPTTSTVRQVATVSSVQRSEEAISSSSDFKRPAEEGNGDNMMSNEAKRSRQ